MLLHQAYFLLEPGFHTHRAKHTFDCAIASQAGAITLKSKNLWLCSFVEIFGNCSESERMEKVRTWSRIRSRNGRRKASDFRTNPSIGCRHRWRKVDAFGLDQGDQMLRHLGVLLSFGLKAESTLGRFFKMADFPLYVQNPLIIFEWVFRSCQKLLFWAISRRTFGNFLKFL